MKIKKNYLSHEEKGIEDLPNNIVVIDDSMLNNINIRRLSKS